MTNIRFGYEIAMDFAVPTPLICLLSVAPDRRGDLIAPDTLLASPFQAGTAYRDLFGNICTRLIAPAGRMTLSSDALIRDSGLPDAADPGAAEIPVQHLPDATMVHLLPSRYCETERLSQFAWDQFGTMTPGWHRVQAIMDYVHSRIQFDYLSASATRTAAEAWREQVGVCRDYAHLAITLCRCLNIPARYVNGYLGDIGVPVGGPMDFAAWTEVFLGGRWWTFDPRNNMRRIGRIVVARGRDAADVPLVHSFGPHVLTRFHVHTDEVAPEAGLLRLSA